MTRYMSVHSLWVPTDVSRKADTILRGASTGQALTEGVELLLGSDISVAGENPGPELGRIDAPGLLVKGLNSLQNNPHEARGIPIGAKTQDIRKASKKADLMSNPDKNPKAAPLFQVIQVTCDKKSDLDERAKAQKIVASNPMNSKIDVDQRVRGVTVKKFADVRAAAIGDSTVQKQKTRDIASNEEQQQSKTELENDRTDGAAAVKVSVHDNAANATRNSYHHTGSDQNNNTSTDALCGIKQKLSQIPLRANYSESVNTPPSVEMCDRQHEPLLPPAMNPVESRVRSQQGAGTKNQIQSKQGTSSVHVPIDFKFITVTDSAVELEWKISTLTTISVLIELSWRKQVLNTSWQSDIRLINGIKCKKNNLELSSSAGCTYEFRLRAIENLPGGILGMYFNFSSLSLYLNHRRVHDNYHRLRNLYHYDF